MRWTSRFVGPNAMVHAVARQAQLVDGAELQESRIRGAVGRVTGDASVGFERSMFVSERPLLVCMALEAPGIGSGREPGLLQLKTTVGIVAIAAFHHSFEDFVMERLVEVRLRFSMATHTKLRFTQL